MWGLVFQIEARLNINPAVTQENNNTIEALQLLEDVYGPFSGQITSATRQAVRKAVLEAGPRLAEAAFLCEITTSSEGLSAVYAVLGRRRSRVLREEMREGSDLFTIHAYLPAEASFGFADELRRRSSGAASASLMLSHWERLGIDPFFVPLTDEEREEFGEEGQGVGAPNLAKRLIDAVRKRKGLAVEQKVVEFATKQRTLARKV
jgi:ribosome assembly protein 1